MTAAKDLCFANLNTLCQTLNLKDISKEQKGFGPLVNPASQLTVGDAKVFGNGKVRLVYVGLAVEAFMLDSHMLFAFTDKHSSAPHFTVDSVKVGESFAFHLDLIPKKDLGANYTYLKNVYRPLNETFSEASKIPGLSPAHITPEQRAIMSPWMLVNRANTEAFDRMGSVVDSYLQHWLKLVDSPEFVDGGEGAVARDRAHRDLLFSPEIDPVWNQIEKTIGPETGKNIRDALKQIH